MLRDGSSWAHVPDVWVRKPLGNFRSQLFESLAAIHVFPAEAPDKAEQSQAILLCPVQIPKPSPVNINEMIVILGHYIYR